MQEIRDPKEIAKHGVLFALAVIVSNESVPQGKIPQCEELEKRLLE